MAEFFINLVVFIISLAVLIIIHEFGHFITAKAFKVYVTEFSIGFGPAIYTKKKDGKETRFSIRGIPLGGYCAMVGETIPEFTEEEYNRLSDKDREMVDLYRTVPQERRLDGIAKWKKAIVMVAGVTLNFLLGFVLLIVFYGTTSFPTMYSNVVEVSAESIASEAGWLSSDTIVSGAYEIRITDGNGTVQKYVRSEECADVTHNLYAIVADLEKYLPGSAQDIASYTLLTDSGKTIQFSLTPQQSETGAYSWPMIGITFTYNFDTHTAKYSAGEVIPRSAETFSEYAVAIFKGIGMLFTKEGISQVGGVISIFQIQQTMMESGFGFVINLWALISINLAIFNLLPFPGLDGWHLLVVIIEGISRREISKKFKNVMSTVGMLILFGLMILVTFKDIFSLF